MKYRTTIAEMMLRAVASLVRDEEKTIFSREEIRQKLDVDRDKWNRSFSPTFQGMRAKPSGKGPKPRKEYQDVFEQVEHGKYQLTKYGQQLIEKLK